MRKTINISIEENTEKLLDKLKKATGVPKSQLLERSFLKFSKMIGNQSECDRIYEYFYRQAENEG